MAVCESCGNEMQSGTSCSLEALHLMGKRFPLPRFGEARGEPRRRGVQCWDCGVMTGGFHHPGCDMQDCPRCGRQLLMCGCGFDEHAIEITVPTGWVPAGDPPPVPFGVDSNGCPLARAVVDGTPVIVHYVDVPESDMSIVDGLRVTTALRTIVDLASSVDDDILRRMVDDALARELFSLADAWARVDQPDLTEHRGAAVLRDHLKTRC